MDYSNIAAGALMVIFLGVLYMALGRRRNASLLGDVSLLFRNTLAHCSPAVRPRIEAAVARRSAQEEVKPYGLWATMGSIIVFFGLIALGFLDPSYAIVGMTTILLGSMVFELLTTRRRERIVRVATLQRRDPQNVAPLWLFVIPMLVFAGAMVLAAITPSVPLVISIAASLVAFGLSFWIIRSPAIVGTEDPGMDALVDQKIRAFRVRKVLIVAAIIPLFLLLVAVPSELVRFGFLIAVVALMVWSRLQVMPSDGEVESALRTTTVG